VVSGSTALPVKTILPASEIIVNPSNGFVRLSAHILGNTIKAGTVETMPVIITDEMLLSFHHINFGTLPSTDVTSSFRFPLTAGKAGLFAQSGAIVHFRNIQVNQSDLLTIPFSTGAATSVKSLFTVNAAETLALAVSAHPLNSTTWKPMATGIVADKMRNFLAEEMNLHKMGIDLSYGNCTYADGNLVLTSQEAFEKARSLFLKSRKELDEAFTTMLQELNREVPFLPVPKAKVETRIVVSSANAMEAIVLHAPQNLDLQQTMGGAGNLFGTRGRLSLISVKINNRTIPNQVVFNSDMNMVVIIPSMPVPLSAVRKTLKLSFRYIQPADETTVESRNTHHRYDRIREVVPTQAEAFDFIVGWI
jgi:hypothetical protein